MIRYPSPYNRTRRQTVADRYVAIPNTNILVLAAPAAAAPTVNGAA